MHRIMTEQPPSLASTPEHLLVDLDVREDLRNGREPFSRIMAATNALPSGGVLRLRATFEPTPLYAVMSRQGFGHWTEALAPDDWRVWFYPASPEPVLEPGSREAGAEPETNSATGSTPPEIVVLDVRGLEPPEPMLRTLAALETLPVGRTLLQINERVPQFLLPKLEDLGFEHQVREQAEGVVRVFIRHARST